MVRAPALPALPLSTPSPISPHASHARLWKDMLAALVAAFKLQLESSARMDSTAPAQWPILSLAQLDRTARMVLRRLALMESFALKVPVLLRLAQVAPLARMEWPLLARLVRCLMDSRAPLALVAHLAPIPTHSRLLAWHARLLLAPTAMALAKTSQINWEVFALPVRRAREALLQR